VFVKDVTLMIIWADKFGVSKIPTTVGHRFGPEMMGGHENKESSPSHLSSEPYLDQNLSASQAKLSRLYSLHNLIKSLLEAFFYCTIFMEVMEASPHLELFSICALIIGSWLSNCNVCVEIYTLPIN
jgi:hypothetical protein